VSLPPPPPPHSRFTVTTYQFVNVEYVERELEKGWEPIPNVEPVTYHQSGWNTPLTKIFLRKTEKVKR
jgi:hypothetical protein